MFNSTASSAKPLLQCPYLYMIRSAGADRCIPFTLGSYEMLYTPHMANIALWKTSGHFDFYKESMFDQMEVEKDSYQIRPMNCPFHVLIYKVRRACANWAGFAAVDQPTFPIPPFDRRAKSRTGTFRCGGPSSGPCTDTSGRARCTAYSECVDSRRMTRTSSACPTSWRMKSRACLI